MSDNVTYIPNRLKNAAKGGYVTGADDIIDDSKGKSQQVINQERVQDIQTLNEKINAETQRAQGVEQNHAAELANRYTKEETNNIISRTPETDVIVIDVPVESQSDIATWLDENTPSSGRANKLYRVPGPTNTTFSEWAWNGTAYIMLANKDYGIDKEPTLGSDNPVEGDGLAKTYGYYIENPEFVDVLLDKNDKIIYAVQNNGNVTFGAGVPKQVIDLVQEKIIEVNGDIDAIKSFLSELGNTTLRDYLDTTYGEYVENPEWINVNVDKDGKILNGTKIDGSNYVHNLKSETIDAISERVTALEEGGDTGILQLYPPTKMLPILKNLKFGPFEGGSSDKAYIPVSFIWFTDVHENSENIQRIKQFYDEYKLHIDDVLFTGDVSNGTFNTYNPDYWNDNDARGFLFVIGNHDAADVLSPYKPVSPQLVYNTFIAPYTSYTNVQFALPGETQPTQYQTYWFKDYPDAKSTECPNGIRLIALDQYHWKESEWASVDYSSELIDRGEQEIWFVGLLEDAKENGMAVIVSLHGATYNANPVECSFNNFHWAANVNYSNIREDMILDVQNFIDEDGNGRRGEFIAWICGHWHQDWVGKIQNIGNRVITQTEMVVSTASNTTPWRDSVLVKNSNGMDCFDILNIEPKEKFIRLYRVGLDYDKYGRHVGGLVYDYKNQNVVFNF